MEESLSTSKKIAYADMEIKSPVCKTLSFKCHEKNLKTYASDNYDL